MVLDGQGDAQPEGTRVEKSSSKALGEIVKISTPTLPPTPALGSRKGHKARFDSKILEQPQSEQNHRRRLVSPSKPGWAREELSWLVDFAQRDEHALRTEARLRDHDETWKRQALAAAAERVSKLETQQRPSTTAHSQWKRPSNLGSRPPKLDLKWLLPDIVSTAASRESANTARLLPGRSNQNAARKSRSALTERERPRLEREHHDLLAGKAYHQIHDKVSALARRRIQQAEDEFQYSLHQSKQDMIQAIIRGDDSAALGSASASRETVGTACSSTARSRRQEEGTLWDGEERLLSGLFEHSEHWHRCKLDVQEGEQSLGTVDGIDSDTSPRHRLDIHGSEEETEEDEESEASSCSDETGQVARKGPGGGQLSKSKRPLLTRDQQHSEISRSIHTMKTDLKHVNEAISGWLRSGGTKVQIDRVTRHIKLRAGSKPAEVARDALSEAHKVQQMLAAVTPGANAKPQADGDSWDHIGSNKAMVDATRPVVRHTKLLNQTVQRCRQLEAVHGRRFSVEKERVEKLRADLETKQAGNRERRRMEEEEAQAAVANQRTFGCWLRAVSWLSRVRTVLWRGRQLAFRRHRAARVIQRRFRAWAASRRQRGGRVWAKNVLRKFLGTVVSTIRFNRNGPAVAVIKLFLYNMQEQAKVIPAIIKFKQRVVMMQGLIRGFLNRVRNAKMHNTNLWDKHVQAEKRELQQMYKERAKKHGISTSAKMTCTKEFIAEHHVPNDVKNTTLRRWLARQRDEYYVNLGVYKLELATFTAQVERKHMLTVRFMEFTGDGEYGRCEERAQRLGGSRFHGMRRPRPTPLRDACSETEMKELWLHAAAHHASAELRAFLFQHYPTLALANPTPGPRCSPPAQAEALSVPSRESVLLCVSPAAVVPSRGFWGGDVSISGPGSAPSVQSRRRSDRDNPATATVGFKTTPAADFTFRRASSGASDGKRYDDRSNAKVKSERAGAAQRPR